MKKRYIISVIGMFLLCSFVNAVPDFSVNPEHPRILITQDNIAELKNRAATTHADTFQILVDYCDDNWDNPSTLDNLYGTGDGTFGDAGFLRCGLVYLLSKDGAISGISYGHSADEYADKTIEVMNYVVDNNNVGIMRYVAIAYDWVNYRMTAEEKTAIVDWFYSKIGDTLQHGPQNGYRWVLEPPSMYPGLAFYGDGINDELAQAYVDFIPEYFESLTEIHHAAGEDGGHPAGLGYGTMFYGSGYGLGYDLYAIVTATSLSTGDVFNEYSYMKSYPAWVLYGIQPGPISPASYSSSQIATLSKWCDCGTWMWNIRNGMGGPYLYHGLLLSAQVAQDIGDDNKAKWILWFLTNRLDTDHIDTTWDLIFHERNIEPISPEQAGLPLSKAFGWDETNGKIDSYLSNPKAGLGQVYMKSSWDIGTDDATTTYASFIAYPYYYYGHQHEDSLAFSIFKGEILTMPSGSYWMKYEGNKVDSEPPVGFPHYWYYYARLASNSILIMDPDEEICIRETDNEYGEKDPTFKDGGQRTVKRGGNTFEEKIPDNKFDWGGLIRYEDKSDYTYSSGDATRGYNSIVDGVLHVGPITSTKDNDPKVSLVQRDFIYLKSSDGNNDYFVVFDRVDSTDPVFEKVFLLHTVGEPILDGAESQIYGDGANGLFESDNTDIFTITNPSDNARLFMRTLLPDTTKVYKMGGSVSSSLTTYIPKSPWEDYKDTEINIPVQSSDLFSDRPVVVIDNGIGREAFQCNGKTSGMLTGCIRGWRYFGQNGDGYDNGARTGTLEFSEGSTVIQDFAWMVRQADSGDWISYPHDFGTPHTDKTKWNDADEFGRWALRIESTEPTTASSDTLTNFLHVLHPTVDMGEAQMAETNLIDAGNMKGALIKDPINIRIVMFSPDTSQVSSVTYEADYISSQTGRHLITGLVPNVNYKIYKDGVEIDSQFSSDQGTVYFESTGGSTFSLSTAALEDCESIGGACRDYSCSAYTDCTPLAGKCSAGYCCQGSCEAASSCSSGADEDNSGEVSMDELVAFIEDWKTGSITIGQVLDAIGDWKSGC